MIRTLKIVAGIVAIATLTACPGGKDNPDNDILDGGGDPGGVSLVFPENNSECTEGQSLNTLESTVTFQWQEGENAESYEVHLLNLDTNSENIINANSNEAVITLTKNTPYQWFVVSSNTDSEETPSSAIWHFYNAGDGVENYAPFPANAINPTRGETIGATGTVTLEWSGNDVDNDIEDYEVFFGTSNDPTSSIANTPQNSASANVSSGQTYYWRVITKDIAGNSSQSEIFDFKVQ